MSTFYARKAGVRDAIANCVRAGKRVSDIMSELQVCRSTVQRVKRALKRGETGSEIKKRTGRPRSPGCHVTQGTLHAEIVQEPRKSIRFQGRKLGIPNGVLAFQSPLLNVWSSEI